MWRWDGTSWTSYQLTNDPVAGISCASETSCRLLFDSGGAFTWDGAGWSKDPASGPLGVSGLACTSPEYCLSTLGAGLLDYNGSSWSAVAPLPGASPAYRSLAAVPACTTTCLIATPDGHVFTTAP